MFRDDVHLVKEMMAKYHAGPPVGDLGGLGAVAMADFDGNRVVLSTVQEPFAGMPGYAIFNPVYGHPPIEEMYQEYPAYFGTVVCLSVLEHVRNPFDVMRGIRDVLKPDGIVILSTVFSYPFHNAPADYWRFTPDGLRLLADRARIKVLESGYRLQLRGVIGLRDYPVDVVTVYIAGQK